MDAKWRKTHHDGAAGRWLFGPSEGGESMALIQIDRLFGARRDRNGRVCRDRTRWLHRVVLRDPRTGACVVLSLWGDLADEPRPTIQAVKKWSAERLREWQACSSLASPSDLPI